MVHESTYRQENQCRQWKNFQHLLEHGEQAREHDGQENRDREYSEGQHEKRIGDGCRHFAANFIFVFEQFRQVGHDLRQRSGFFAHAHHADVKFVEKPRMLFERGGNCRAFAD